MVVVGRLIHFLKLLVMVPTVMVKLLMGIVDLSLGSNSSTGDVYIYQYTNSSWNQIGNITRDTNDDRLE